MQRNEAEVSLPIVKWLNLYNFEQENSAKPILSLTLEKRKGEFSLHFLLAAYHITWLE